MKAQVPRAHESSNAAPGEARTLGRQTELPGGGRRKAGRRRPQARA